MARHRGTDGKNMKIEWQEVRGPKITPIHTPYMTN
jgi:hypothetical protein